MKKNTPNRANQPKQSPTTTKPRQDSDKVEEYNEEIFRLVIIIEKQKHWLIEMTEDKNRLSKQLQELENENKRLLRLSQEYEKQNNYLRSSNKQTLENGKQKATTNNGRPLFTSKNSINQYLRNNEIANIISERDQLEIANQELRDHCRDLRRQVEDLQHQNEELTNQKIQLLSENLNRIEKLEEELENLTNQRKNFQIALNERNKEKASLQNEITSLRKEIELLESQLDEKDTRNQTEKSYLQKENTALQQLIDQRNLQCSSLQSQIEQLLQQPKKFEDIPSKVFDSELHSLQKEIKYLKEEARRNQESWREEKEKLTSRNTELLQQISGLQKEIKKSKSDCIQSQSCLKQLSDENKLLNEKLQQLIYKKKELEEEQVSSQQTSAQSIQTQKEQIIELKSELERQQKAGTQENERLLLQTNGLAQQVEDLKNNIKNLKRDYHEKLALKDECINELKKENSSLTEENTTIKQQLKAQTDKPNELLTKNQYPSRKTEEQKKEARNSTLSTSKDHSKKEDHDSVPYASIRVNSLFSLANQGWNVKTNLLDQVSKLQSEFISIISILGPLGTGKTWLASKLSGINLHSAQKDAIPANVSLYYALKGGCFGIIDSSGFNGPIPANDDEIVQNLPLELASNDTRVRTQRRTQLLYNDSKILEELRLAYSIQSGGLVLLVLGKLTQTDIEYISFVKEMMKVTGTSTITQNPLIIVHNFSWLTTKAQVEEHITQNLQKVLLLKEEPLFNSNESSEIPGATNKSLYKDETGLTHLILAAADSEAGDYYNPGTLKFLSSKVNLLESKTKLPFAENFATFCNEKLKRIFNADFHLSYDESHSQITSQSHEKIDPRVILNYEVCNMFVEGDFKPKYSKSETRLENGHVEVVVDVELLDCKFDPKIVRKSGCSRLVLTGSKAIQRKEGKNMNFDQGTRADGSFVVAISLLRNMEIVSHSNSDLGSGIRRFTIEFKPHEEESV